MSTVMPRFAGLLADFQHRDLIIHHPPRFLFLTPPVHFSSPRIVVHLRTPIRPWDLPTFGQGVFERRDQPEVGPKIKAVRVPGGSPARRAPPKPRRWCMRCCDCRGVRLTRQRAASWNFALDTISARFAFTPTLRRPKPHGPSMRGPLQSGGTWFLGQANGHLGRSKDGGCWPTS